VRLKPYAEKLVGRYQAAFRSGRSTIDQISTLKQILEKMQEQHMETHHIFVDFKAAYDSVDRAKLYDAMEELGIPNHLISLTRLTMQKVACRVRIQGHLSPPFETSSGLRQEDALSCTLFNLALEKVVRSAQINRTGTIFNKSVQVLAFADDVDIIGRSEAAVKEAYVALKAAAGN
jgi:hypothetical protein